MIFLLVSCVCCGALCAIPLWFAWQRYAHAGRRRLHERRRRDGEAPALETVATNARLKRSPRGEPVR